jgi:hypothetical protein
MNDHQERKRRLFGRETEIYNQLRKVKEILGTPKVKRTLLDLAEYLARNRHFPLVPRLERRHLDMLVAWFLDHFPAMFECTSLNEMFTAGLRPQTAQASAEPALDSEDEDPWRFGSRFDDEEVHDFRSLDDEGSVDWPVWE